MCFKAPKLVEPTVDPNIEIARRNSAADLLSQKERDRLAQRDNLRSRGMGGFGLRSLITGRAGGEGYGRSLIGG